MGFRQSDLQPAFDIPGTHPFRVWGYGTTDPLEEVLGPGYMCTGASMLHSGELIYVRSCPRREAADGRAAGARRSGATTGGRPWEPAARMALVMVVGWERNAMRLRLVQDFGRPEDGAGPARASESRPPASTPILAAPALPQAPPSRPSRRRRPLPRPWPRRCCGRFRSSRQPRTRRRRPSAAAAARPAAGTRSPPSRACALASGDREAVAALGPSAGLQIAETPPCA